MDLSIIIVNYNTPKLTRDAVASIYKNRQKIKFEVFIVENGSDDDSIEKLTKLQRKSLRLIKLDRNLGFSKGNNVAIKKAKGRHILLLNSDTVVKKDALDELVHFVDTHQNSGVVGAKLLNKDGSTQPSVFRLPTIGRTISHYILGRKILSKYAPKSSKATEVESVVGAAFLITPKARNYVGLLDERYFMYFEDLDYCRKVRSKGLKIFYLPSARIVHLHGRSAKKVGSKSMKYLNESSQIYHGKVKYFLITSIIRISQIIFK